MSNTNFKPLRDLYDQNDKINPDKLFDAVIERFNLKNDAALCRMLQVAPPVISKVRHGHLGVSAALLVRLHDATNMSFSEMRALMGVGQA